MDEPTLCKPVICAVPSFIEHGRFSGNLTYTSRVEYFCEAGYEIQANVSNKENAVSACQANRTWNHNPPHCLPISCGTPENVPNAGYLGSSFTYGSEVVYACDVGYELKVSYPSLIFSIQNGLTYHLLDVYVMLLLSYGPCFVSVIPL